MLPPQAQILELIGQLIVLSIISLSAATTITGFNASLTWNQCFGPTLPVSCANLSLPIDWNQPNGDHFDLFISKIPAKIPHARIGNLIYNPGGPGAGFSANLKASDFDKWNHSRLADVFDVITIDPRGTGNSRPVRCNATVVNKHMTYFPKTESEFEHLVTQLEARGRSCYEETGDWLRFIDTASTVKDIEAVRIALGGDDEPLSFLGISYGTQVGAQYIELFPDKVRAMVLDSVFDHSQIDPMVAWERESRNYETVVAKFFEWCEGAGASCALNHLENIPAWFDDLARRLDEHPISYYPGGPCENYHDCAESFRSEAIISQLGALLRDPNGSPGYQSISSSLLLLGTKGLPGVFQGISQRSDNNNKNNSASLGFAAISCVDLPRAQKPDFATYRARMEYARSISPHTQGWCNAWFQLAQCPYWPVPVTNPAHEITTFQNGAHNLTTPILIVNAYFDPLTPYDGAVRVQRQFGDMNAALLSRDRFGHGSWGYAGAVSDAIVDYLINLEVPAHGTALRNYGL